MEARVAELKGRLEKALRQPLPQAAINHHMRSGAIREYFEGRLERGKGEHANFQSLKELFREILPTLKEHRNEVTQRVVESSSIDREVPPPVALSGTHGSYVSKRAEAISEVWAALADDRPDVTEYRQAVLRGGAMSPEEATKVVAAPEAVLGELRALELDKLRSILANDYYGWDKQGAVWYVLTGEAPRLRPVRIRARGKAPVAHYVPLQYDVNFSVLPWVPAEEVENAYRTVQRQLLDGPLRKSAPRTGARVLEVVQFWWERFRANGQMPSWRDSCELWNLTHPEKQFKTWRSFRTYFFRGTKDAQATYIRFPQPAQNDGKQEVPEADAYAITTVQGHRNWGLNDKYTEVTFE